MTRQPGSLTARLFLAMTLVAAVATGATGLLAAPLLRGSVEDAARGPIGRQADLLARLPNVELLVQRVERQVAVRDLELGVVTSTGQRQGAATALSRGQVDRLLEGQEISGTGRLGGDRVVIEARPTVRGGGVVLAASANSVDESATALRRRLLLALLLGLVLALAAAAAVGSRVARPLARTAAAARQLASGERGVSLPAPGTREVGDVIDALGGLDQALTASESRQREFLLSVSHELRTPLTALRGLAEGLADGTIPATEARSVGRTMAAESQRLARYVDDLLALARMEADDFTVRREEMDLAVLVRDAAAAWQERARRSGMTVRAEGCEHPVPLTSDDARLRQVVDALADNAVRVCPAESVLVVAVRVEAGLAVLEVRDSGPGLTADDLEHAFEPGVLHDRYAATRAGGQGLGLALVHRMVTRLGGTIKATTAAEGGVAFTVALPR